MSKKDEIKFPGERQQHPDPARTIGDATMAALITTAVLAAGLLLIVWLT